MPTPREILINTAIRIIEHGVEAYITPKPPSLTPPTLTEESSQKKAEPECKSCPIHINIGIAYAYLKGLSNRVEPGDRIPVSLTPTIELARLHIGEAENRLVSLMESDPAAYYDVTVKLASCLPDIEKRLTLVENGTEVHELKRDTEKALDIAYRIPERILTESSPKTELEQLKAEVQELKGRLENGERRTEREAEECREPARSS